MIKKKVDIVMPCHNRWKMTKQSLDSLFAHTDLRLFNLYVIDDGSDPNDREELRKYYLCHALNIYLNDQAIAPGPCRNKVCSDITNHGWRSEYLYHSDNDVYFTEGWLEKLIQTYKFASTEKPCAVKLLGGGCHPYLQNNKILSFNTGIVGIKDAVSGYSQLMTWETWDTYGPFAEDMRGAEIKIMGSEDWAFCQRIVKDGYLVGSIEPEVVVHCGKTNTYGNPATGNETFRDIPGIVIE